ncbi:phage portal protein [Photorhabdus sp. SF281]|uniref:phage portal protein n=1 Tax=Photorhabdus sp. SF281 TaxID=3459527 RepID=UPI004044C8EF
MTKKTMIGRLTDGLHSMLTSLGERVAAIKYASNGKADVPDKELLAMYKNSWVVKKYIDKTADDMLKLPRELSGDIDSSLIQRIKDTETALAVYKIFRDALTWASLLGDSLIIAITDCSDEMIGEQLRLQDEDIVKFLVLRKGEYTPASNVISDIASPHFGQPQTYQIDIGNKQLKFHHSRCHRTKLGEHSLKDMPRFGTSDIQAPYDAIKIFDAAIVSTGDTIQEANVDVIFLPGLNAQIDAGQETQVIEYARVMKQTKSSTGLMLMDAGDSTMQSRYEQKTAQFSGLSDVITKMANVLAGALDRPINILFGQSASGFNSGEEDNKSYYETINGLQETRLRQMQDFVDQFILDKLAASIDVISYEYQSIDSINEADEATRFTQYATGFTSLVQSSVVTEDIALREMQAKGVLTTVTNDEIEAMAGVNNGQWYQSETDAGAQTGAFEGSQPFNASADA